MPVGHTPLRSFSRSEYSELVSYPSFQTWQTTSLSDVQICGADLVLPSVVTTLAYTNCGDRIHQGEVTKRYRDVVASRFATLSKIGELKTWVLTLLRTHGFDSIKSAISEMSHNWGYILTFCS